MSEETAIEAMADASNRLLDALESTLAILAYKGLTEDEKIELCEYSALCDEMRGE